MATQQKVTLSHFMLFNSYKQPFKMSTMSKFVK